MRKRKDIQFVVLGLMIATAFLSCGKLFNREIDCRELNNGSHLKWFAGGISDTIAFVKPDNTVVKFVVDDKYLYHRTKYISDTGCGCHDMWGIRLSSPSDTISMYNQEKYVNDNESNVYSTCYVTIDGVTSGFITEDKSVVSSMSINSTSVSNLIKFKFANNEAGQFTEVYIAENIGIVQMVSNNGDKWINQNLIVGLDVSFGSFLYEENTCA